MKTSHIILGIIGITLIVAAFGFSIVSSNHSTENQVSESHVDLPSQAQPQTQQAESNSTGFYSLDSMNRIVNLMPTFMLLSIGVVLFTFIAHMFRSYSI